MFDISNILQTHGKNIVGDVPESPGRTAYALKMVSRYKNLAISACREFPKAVLQKMTCAELSWCHAISGLELDIENGKKRTR